MYIPAWVLILTQCTIFAIGNLITYIIGVTQDHYRAVFPYISDTGAYPIENGFFVLVFVLTALFTLLVMYVRYKDIYTHIEGLCFRITNFVFLIIGFISLFFLVAVAAFEFDDSSLSNRLHFASAVLTIFFNYAYSFGQAFLGIFLPPKFVWWKWLVFVIQLSMTILGIILFFYFFASSFLDSNQLYLSVGRDPSSLGNDTALLNQYYEGLTIDYTRAVVEWLIFVEVLGFYLTLIPDFHRIRVNLAITRPLDNEVSKEDKNEMHKV